MRISGAFRERNSSSLAQRRARIDHHSLSVRGTTGDGVVTENLFVRSGITLHTTRIAVRARGSEMGVVPMIQTPTTECTTRSTVLDHCIPGSVGCGHLTNHPAETAGVDLALVRKRNRSPRPFFHIGSLKESTKCLFIFLICHLLLRYDHEGTSLIAV